MQSIKDMPVLQDGPPPGGFPSVRYARRIPSTGPAGFTLFAVTASIMAYGFIKVSQHQYTKHGYVHIMHPTNIASACTCPWFEGSCVFQVGQTNHEKRAAKAEKKSARFAIMPILQAEEDRR